jgi:hypothetical protein
VPERLLRFARSSHALEYCVGLTILVAFGSVLFALWNDREEAPTE